MGTPKAVGFTHCSPMHKNGFGMTTFLKTPPYVLPHTMIHSSHMILKIEWSHQTHVYCIHMICLWIYTDTPWPSTDILWMSVPKAKRHLLIIPMGIPIGPWMSWFYRYRIGLPGPMSHNRTTESNSQEKNKNNRQYRVWAPKVEFDSLFWSSYPP